MDLDLPNVRNKLEFHYPWLKESLHKKVLDRIIEIDEEYERRINEYRKTKETEEKSFPKDERAELLPSKEPDKENVERPANEKFLPQEKIKTPAKKPVKKESSGSFNKEKNKNHNDLEKIHKEVTAKDR